jgi:hypothetical protein
MYQHELSNILNAYNILNNVPSNMRSDKYKEIVRFHAFKIHENCSHNIIQDSIDTDVDYSQTIYYCDTCRLTFNIDFFYSYMTHNLQEVNKNLWRLNYDSIQYTLLDYSMSNGKILLTIYKPSSDIDTSYKQIIPVYLNDLFCCHIENNILYIN